MKHTLLFFLFVLQVSMSQNISGTILDLDTNQPLENVTIYIQTDKSGAVSDENGKFKVSLNSRTRKTDSIQFSLIGYFTKRLAINEFKKQNNVIRLSKKLEDLDEVIVNSNLILKDEIAFKKLASLETGVYDFGSQVVGNYIYVIAGNSSYIEDPTKRAFFETSTMQQPGFGAFLKELRRSFSSISYSDQLQIYNIETNSWSISDKIFRKRFNHNLNTYGNDLYLLGGKCLSNIGRYEYLDNKIEVYKMGADEVILDHSNPHQAANFASITYNDNIIVMGGSTKLKKNGEKVYSDETHIYNITSGMWYELPKMKTAKETQGVVVNDKIYLIGGNNGNSLNTIEAYNLKTAKWTKEGELFNRMENPALTSHENIIFIFYDNKLSTYDTITKTLEEYDITLKLRSPKMHYHKNKLYLLGGYILDDYSTTASGATYVIDIDEFSKTAPLNSKAFN